MPNAKDYTVDWVCAINIEYVAARACLDETHEIPESALPKCSSQYMYTPGRIGALNIVVAVLMSGQYGAASTAALVSNMRRNFPNMHFGLSVGIGGGVSSVGHDIRIGDIVMTPLEGKGSHGGNIKKEGRVYHIPRLAPISPDSAVSHLIQTYREEGNRLKDSIENLLRRYPGLEGVYKRPEPGTDRLFRTERNRNVLSSNSDDNSTSSFRAFEQSPVVHCGQIASGEEDMSDASLRDDIANKVDILAFETEAVGLLYDFPFLIIRGISDYADSHKPLEWQAYSALAAAVCGMEILRYLSSSRIFPWEAMPQPHQDTLRSVSQSTTRPFVFRPTHLSQIANTDSSSSPTNIVASQFMARPCILIYFAIFLIVAGASSVGLLYAIGKDKMGDGFTTAAFILAAGALLLVGPITRHAPHCRCWSRETSSSRGPNRVSTLQQ